MEEPYPHEQLWVAGNHRSTDSWETDSVVPRIHKVAIRDDFGFMKTYSTDNKSGNTVVA
jgi:hypothetical protein